MKFAKKTFIFLLLVISLSLIACNNNDEKENSFQFIYWNESQALTSLTTYVTAVTDEKSSDYIPEQDRIAVFDMDNFRMINDTYGYEFGDEYLASIADRLKEEFGDVAEIYNITGNEFCFVFNKEYSESQSMAFVQKIHSVLTSPYTVLNLTVQLTASGAAYHYLPGDCLNVNSLLVKLDTTMRNAKMNGGNMISTVMNI